MQNKIFSFRWDIDHLYGLEKGVPNIISVCNEFNVKCSFYINMGKAFNLREWLFKSFKKSITKLTDSASINIIQKLGYFKLFHLIALNPNVGSSRIDLLNMIVGQGHELGLHGAGDHMLWSRRIKDFDTDTIEKIVLKTLYHFEAQLSIKRFGFAAPGFSWSTQLLESIDRLGFAYTGDLPGDQPFYPKIDSKKFNHLCIPVNIIGPNTVPVIEYHSALGKEDNEIVDAVLTEINKKEFAIIYGHPVFEGFKVDIIRRIFSHAIENGYRVLTHKEIYEEYKDNAPVHELLNSTWNNGDN